MTICIVNFSSRKNGNCFDIAQTVARQFKNEHIVMIHFSDLKIHACGRCDYECFSDHQVCPYHEDDLIQLYDHIIESRLCIMIVPNYCDYPPANFFKFNERSQCYFQSNQGLLEKYLSVSKKFITVSNTNEENFTKAFMYHTTMNPDILFLSAKKYGKVSIEGDLMSNAEALNDVVRFCEYVYA